MYKSLKPWLDLPVTIKPFLRRSGTGDKVFGDSVIVNCYAEGKIVAVKNNEGKEVVSHKQLYLDGNTAIDERDNIVFEGRETEITSISYFYRAGVVDIKVVFL